MSNFSLPPVDDPSVLDHNGTGIADADMLSLDPLEKMDAFWHAANYLPVGQIRLCDNPLLKMRVELSRVKPLVISHWGTTPSQNFVYPHLNRMTKRHDLT